MSKQISQKTFDGVVLENILEFDMEAEEAVKDAIQQFESQVRIFNILMVININDKYYSWYW